MKKLSFVKPLSYRMSHETNIPEDWSLFSDRPAIASCYDIAEKQTNDQCTMDPFGKGIRLSSAEKEKIILFDTVTPSKDNHNKSGPCNLVLTENLIYCIFGTNDVERYAIL